MSDIVSRDVMEWARDLAHIRDLVAGESVLDRVFPLSSVKRQFRAATIIQLRPLVQETTV